MSSYLISQPVALISMIKKLLTTGLLTVTLPVWAAFDITFPAPNEILQAKEIGSVASELPTSFSITSWNIFKGHKDTFPIEYPFASERRDLLLIQESSLSDQVMALYSRENWALTTAISFIHEGIPTGVSTLSKAIPLTTFFLKSRKSEPILKTPKMTLVSIFAFKDSLKKLFVGNLHGLNFVGNSHHSRQINDLKNLAATHVGPIIIAGDFNSWSKDRQEELHKIMSTLGLSEVKFQKDERTKYFGEKIDYIFYRELNLISASVGGEFGSSDHKPLFARFSLK